MPRDGEPGVTSVREAVFALMRRLDMTTVFGNPGSTELPFLDRWPEDIRYELCLAEAVAVAMADGHARATGRAALCNLHSAVGIGHAMGNLFTAFRNQAPVVVTVGQQARSLLPHNPFLGATDAAAFPRPYVKWSLEPARAEDVPAAIAHAHAIAMQHPRGPVMVSIPMDDWTKPARPVPARAHRNDTAPDPEGLAECARVLAAAQRPVIVAGAEVDAEGAGPALVALAERLRAPVLAAPFASRLCFPEDHPLFAGFLPAAPAAIGAALAPFDAILVAGAPVFTFHVAGDCPVFEGAAPLFQLTADGEAAAAAGIGTALLGSLRLGLPALRALLPEATRDAPAPRPPAPVPEPGSPLRAEWLFAAIRARLPAGAVVVEEAPSHRPAIQRHLPIGEWGGFFTMASGGLGHSLPAAMGVALAGRRVVAIIGDGSMLYCIQALWNAAQGRLPVTVVVVNNAGYGAMRSFSGVLGVTGAPGIDVPGVDFSAIATGFGVPARRCETAEQVAAALEEGFALDGPLLLDVPVDPAIPHLYAKAK